MSEEVGTRRKPRSQGGYSEGSKNCGGVTLKAGRTFEETGNRRHERGGTKPCQSLVSSELMDKVKQDSRKWRVNPGCARRGEGKNIRCRNGVVLEHVAPGRHVPAEVQVKEGAKACEKSIGQRKPVQEESNLVSCDFDRGIPQWLQF